MWVQFRVVSGRPCSGARSASRPFPAVAPRHLRPEHRPDRPVFVADRELEPDRLSRFERGGRAGNQLDVQRAIQRLSVAAPAR